MTTGVSDLSSERRTFVQEREQLLADLREVSGHLKHLRMEALAQAVDKARDLLTGLVLPGWSCQVCGVFTGTDKGATSCRSCGTPRP